MLAGLRVWQADVADAAQPPFQAQLIELVEGKARDGVRDTPVCRHGLTRPDRTRLASGLIADSEDEVQFGAVRASEFVPALRPETLQLEAVSRKHFERQSMNLAPELPGAQRRPSRANALLRLKPFGQPGFDLVSYSAEDGKPLFVSSGRARGILERPVNSLPDAGYEWAVLVRVVADRDEVVDRCLHRLGQYLRGVPADVDAPLRHHSDGERMHRGLLGAGTLGVETIAGE